MDAGLGPHGAPVAIGPWLSEVNGRLGSRGLPHSMRPNVGCEFLLTNEHGIFYGIKSYGLRQGNDFIDIFSLVNI